VDCEICASRGWIHPDDGTGHQCCGGHSGHLQGCSVWAAVVREAAEARELQALAERGTVSAASLARAGATNFAEAMDRGRQVDEPPLRFEAAEAPPFISIGTLTPPPDRSVALGAGARADGPLSVAIGPDAHAPAHSLAVAFGNPKRQIRIGPNGKVTLEGFENPDNAAIVFWAALEEFNPLLRDNERLTKRVNELVARLGRIRILSSKAERTGAVLDQIERLAGTEDEPLEIVKTFSGGIVEAIRARTQT